MKIEMLMMLIERETKVIMISTKAELTLEENHQVVGIQFHFKMTEEIKQGQEAEIRSQQDNVIRLDQIRVLTKPKDGHQATTV